MRDSIKLTRSHKILSQERVERLAEEDRKEYEQYLNTPIIASATTATVESRLKKIAYIYSKSSNSLSNLNFLINSPVHKSIDTWLFYTSQTNLIKCLFKLEANPNIQDIVRESPLHFAIKCNHTETVLAILANPRTDPNIQGQHGHTPLHRAARQGCREAVIALFTHPKTAPNIQCKGGYTPLHWTVKKDHTETLAALLADPRTDPNKQDAKGYTPLHRAVKNERREAITTLLASNARVNLRTLRTAFIQSTRSLPQLTQAYISQNKQAFVSTAVALSSILISLYARYSRCLSYAPEKVDSFN